MDQQTIITVLVAGGVVGVGLIVARLVSDQLSNSFGWTELAELYPVKTEYPGEWKKRQSLYVQDIFFPDCVDIGADETALYFTFKFPLQTWKRVQIPWDALSNVIVRGKTLEIDIARVKLRIRQSSFNAIALGNLIPQS